MDNTVLLRFEKEEYNVHTRALARRHEGHSKLQQLLLLQRPVDAARKEPACKTSRDSA